MPTLSLLLLFVAVAAGFYSSEYEAALNTVTLPIEVYALNGTSAHTESVTLQISVVSGVNRLYVKAHQPFYHVGGVEIGEWEGFDAEAAVDIRVNGGAWVQVRDENVTCAYPESEYGCVAGGYATIRFTIPVSNAVSGANTVEFRFNGTDGARAGFRVLGVGFMNSSDDIQTFDFHTDGAVDGTTFVYDDFSSWTPPSGYDNPSDIAAGKNLFASRNILINDLIRQQPVIAACNDCHAVDGSDLKYFNYSNRTLIARSMMHGLDEVQGKQIAAYIRSIDLKKENGMSYDAPGTPWDPPFQPGPTLRATGEHPDVSDQVYWASGAGLDWVLDYDEDALPYIFPNGQGGVDRMENGDLNWHHLSTDSTLNMRAIPIALQMPDWNNWLPDIHPVDAWGNAFTNHSYNSNPGAWDKYVEMVGDPRNGDFGGTLESRIFTLTNDLDKTSNDFRKWNEVRNKFRNLTMTQGSMTDAEWAKAKLSFQQWQLVHLWEMHTHYYLQDKAATGFVGLEFHDYLEPLGWIGRNRAIFDVAPHIHGGNNNPPYPYGTRLISKFFTHAWYDLQLIINPGVHPRHTMQSPVDWAYQPPHTRSLAGVSGVGAGLRMFISEVKKIQIFWNPEIGLDTEKTGEKRAWVARHTAPSYILEMASGKAAALYSNLSNELKADLATAYLRSWWDRQDSFPIEDFPRRSQPNDNSSGLYWEHSNQVPDMNAYLHPNAVVDKIYQGIPEMVNLGVALGVLDSITTWAVQMWPLASNPTWDELVVYSPPDDSSGSGNAMHAIPLQGGWNIVSSSVAPSEPAMDSVFADIVDDIVLVKNSAGQTYIPEFNINMIGDWNSLEGYMVYAQANTTLTVEGDAIVPETANIALLAGWNLASYLRNEPMAAETALASIASVLVIVKDFAGNVYIPEFSINTIGDMEPGKGYKIFVDQAATLTYPANSEASARAVSEAPLAMGNTMSKAGTATPPGMSASAVLIVEAPTLSDGDEISIWAPDRRLVGQGTAQQGRVLIILRGDELLTENVVEGAKAGDELMLDVQSGSSTERRQLSVTSFRDVLAGRHFSGALRYEDDALLVAQVAELPSTFSLSQNYPNPFNPSTTIAYGLPVDAHVRLEVYNALGQRVAVLVDEERKAGLHTVVFKADHLASGLYVYRIQAAHFSKTQKMLLMK